MAGTINLALTQQFDAQGDPLSGGLLQTLTAGTTTPQPSFQDFGLTILHPNPIVLDASGRVPMFYLADGFIKIRLTDKNGVVVIAADQMLVIGPSTGTSGGAGVDVTTVLQTGDIKSRYGTGVLDGFVRCNGLTIGQVGSSATELAGVKAQALYEYLWPFPNIALDSAVKGVNAVTDFGLLKRLILPDLRGRIIAGMDDMGATAAARLTSTYFGASAIVLGNVGGTESKTLTAAQLPGHTHSGSSVTGNENQAHNHQIVGTTGGNNETLDHTHNYGDQFFSQTSSAAAAGGSGTGSNSSTSSTTGPSSIGAGVHTHNMNFTSGNENQAHNHNFSFTTNTGDGVTGTPHAIVAPTMVLTIYIKL